MFKTSFDRVRVKIDRVRVKKDRVGVKPDRVRVTFDRVRKIVKEDYKNTEMGSCLSKQKTKESKVSFFNSFVTSACF